MLGCVEGICHCLTDMWCERRVILPEMAVFRSATEYILSRAGKDSVA